MAEEKIDDGGPVHPSKVDGFSIESAEKDRFKFTGTHPGMSLRDHFAGLAMQAMLSGRHPDDIDWWLKDGRVARDAYEASDHMLARRKQA